jgi:hypothetical protein
VPREKLVRLAGNFQRDVEIIADFDRVHEHADFKVSRASLLELLRRRPCSLADVAQGLEVHPGEALKYLDDLRAEGAIDTTVSNGTVYFRVRTK